MNTDISDRVRNADGFLGRDTQKKKKNKKNQKKNNNYSVRDGLIFQDDYYLL